MSASSRNCVSPVSFVMSFVPAWNNSVSTGRIFTKLGFRLFFDNTWRKFKFSVIPNKNDG